jgi:hypothetical protein
MMWNIKQLSLILSFGTSSKNRQINGEGYYNESGGDDTFTNKITRHKWFKHNKTTPKSIVWSFSYNLTVISEINWTSWQNTKNIFY